MDKLTLVLLAFSLVFAAIAVTRVGDPDWRKLMSCSAVAYVAAELFGGLYHFFVK